jgi:hypothetical protein
MNKFIQKNRERIDFNGQIFDFMCLVPLPNFQKVWRTPMENPNGKGVKKKVLLRWLQEKKVFFAKCRESILYKNRPT